MVIFPVLWLYITLVCFSKALYCSSIHISIHTNTNINSNSKANINVNVKATIGMPGFGLQARLRAAPRFFLLGLGASALPEIPRWV